VANDLGQFARRMKELGRQIEVNSNDAAIETALAASTAVTLATPVDTGRARANWQAELGSPITEPTDAEDQAGSDTINRNRSRIRSRRGEQPIFLSNNLPYIGALNAGSSAQAPANFVETAVQAGVRAIRKARLLRR